MTAAPPAIERFPALDRLPWLRGGLVCRVPGVNTASCDKAAALAALRASHAAAIARLGLGDHCLRCAEQVHGAGVAVVDENSPAHSPGVDALITRSARVCLGIHVADCCPVFLADPVQRAIGLAHSGSKGTARGIVPATIRAMREAFGTRARDLIVQLGPCIRPPFYETDFAAEIVRQCTVAGVGAVCDCGHNTASDLTRYYSYRLERGKTGRMLAVLALVPAAP